MRVPVLGAAREPAVVRRVARARPGPGPPPESAPSTQQDPPNGTNLAAKPILKAARRVVESVIVAAVTSTSLYLV